jgi:hypothetical protein
MLGNFRTKLGLPTRRPAERPERIEILHRDSAGNVTSDNVPLDDYPDIAVGYRLPPAGILVGGRRDDPIEGDLIVQTNVLQLESHRIPGKDTILKLGGFNTLKFMRMVAKIGHAHAIAKLGVKAFRPLLPELILGTSTEARWLIGRDPNSESLPAATTIHDLWLEQVEVANGRFLLAGVRLFSFAGLPKYHVVVGEQL